ncbi:hypothetical protein ACFV2H_13240 [Streptomyces sp. NPDC059629]
MASDDQWYVLVEATGFPSARGRTVAAAVFEISETSQETPPAHPPA